MRDTKRKPSNSTSATQQPDENVCAGHALGFPLRSSLGFRPIENVTLDVFRCVCDVYATSSAQPWEIAIRISEEQLGPIDGPLLVARVTALLRALRKERGSGFSYLSVGCQHVSPDELTVTGLLKAARNGDKTAFERGIALALNNAELTDRTRIAVRSLAEAQSSHWVVLDNETNASDFENQTVQAVYLH